MVFCRLRLDVILSGLVYLPSGKGIPSHSSGYQTTQLPNDGIEYIIGTTSMFTSSASTLVSSTSILRILRDAKGKLREGEGGAMAATMDIVDC